MADLQILFHNPEALSDRDLKQMRMRMRLQRIFPYCSAGAFGGAMYFLDTSILRRSMCFMRIGALAAGGFLCGATYSYRVNMKSLSSYSGEAQENFDSDIVGAFENKYVQRSLNAAGYGNNALTLASHSKELSAIYKKPY